MALAMADYAVTEAGFAFDLGGEKFFDLKCRAAGLNPAAIVLVATIRALKMHGGVELDKPRSPNPAAVERGLENLAAHLDSARPFRASRRLWPSTSLPPIRPRNSRSFTTIAPARRSPASTADVFSARAVGGAIELAEKVVAAASGPATPFNRSIRSTGRPSRRSNRSPGSCMVPMA